MFRDLEVVVSDNHSTNVAARLRPSISIGMPVYNGTQFIREALDSMLAQTFTDFELIISDNASTDDTEAICREYAAEDTRIRYVRQLVNRGAEANFQFVLDEAIGTHFMWAAADDKAAVNFVQKLFQSSTENPEFVLVMSDVMNISDDGRDLFITRIDNIRMDDVKTNWLKRRFLFFNNPTSNIFFCIYGLFKTEALRTAQFNYKNKVKYATGCEIPLLAQVSLAGKIGTVPETLKHYRRHRESIFHKESNEFDVFAVIDNYFNISRVLASIVVDAALPLSMKTHVLLRLICRLPWFFSRLLVGRVIRRLRFALSTKAASK